MRYIVATFFRGVGVMACLLAGSFAAIFALAIFGPWGPIMTWEATGSGTLAAWHAIVLFILYAFWAGLLYEPKKS